jgi:hypothetical protein
MEQETGASLGDTGCQIEYATSRCRPYLLKTAAIDEALTVDEPARQPGTRDDACAGLAVGGRILEGMTTEHSKPPFSRMLRPHHHHCNSPHSQTRNPKHAKLRKQRVNFSGAEGARARQIRTAAAIQAAPIAP